MIKKFLSMILLWGSLAIPAFGEVKIDWRSFDAVQAAAKEGATPFHPSLDEKIIQCKRKDVLQTIITLASKFTERAYGDFGPYNFFTSYKKFTLKFVINENGRSFYNPKTRTFEFGAVTLSDMTKFSVDCIHEFSHGYDHVFGLLNNVSLKGVIIRAKELSEATATYKESLYIEEVKDKIPPDIYQRLLTCYSSATYLEAYYEAYKCRSGILREWYNR